MKLRCLLFGCIVFALRLQAQDSVMQQYGNQITIANLHDYLNILASDAMEGRETGKRGQKIAAAFISAHYEDIGLTAPVNGSYFQTVELYSTVQGEVSITSGGKTFKNFQDVVYYGSVDSGGEISLPVVFAGKGRPEDLLQADVKDKCAIVLLDTDESFRPADEALRAKGAKTVFFFYPNPDEFKSLAAEFKSYLGGGLLSLNKPAVPVGNTGVFFISPVVAENLLGIPIEKMVDAVKAKPQKKAIKKIKHGFASFKAAVQVKTTKTENVLAFLEGSDRKEEIIVITSHYDHIGKKEKGKGDLINNGADDDGSGTVCVMELARVFAQAKKDGHGARRSILFMNVTGEEKGLLGSDYYTRHPVFPLSNTVTDLNVDMIGRRDPQHANSAPYVYVIGSDKLSKELHVLNERMNAANTNLILDYTYNDQNHPDRLYYRSDHWNFAKHNIPIIFYFDGIHEDYHLPSDEIDKIEFDLLRKRSQLIFYTAWEIANRKERITPDSK
jgi:hypothetical protein